MEAIDFDRMMSEVGPLDDQILACIKTPDGAYAVRFEQLDVLVEWDEDRERIALSVEIGTPRPSQALDVYETLLSYNLLWRETGGVRMALTGRGGAVVQFVDLNGPEINPASIATVAANLSGLGEIWRAFLESEEGGEAAPAPMSLGDFIRA